MIPLDELAFLKERRTVWTETPNLFARRTISYKIADGFRNKNYRYITIQTLPIVD